MLVDNSTNAGMHGWPGLTAISKMVRVCEPAETDHHQNGLLSAEYGHGT